MKIEASRSGLPTAAVRGVYLHSRYDPGAEADRYAREALGERRPSRVLLLGAGLGYLIEAVQRRAGTARVVPVYYDRSLYEYAVGTGPAGGAKEALLRAWHPGMEVPLVEYLRAEIPELECEGLAILEWPPSARVYPEAAREANSAVRQVLRELRGTLVTTAALGRRWLRNAFRNFALLEDHFLDPPGGDKPVLVAASGPSLEEALPLIHEHRDRFSLWALPSSLLALADAGLHPDLVVLTDPSYYAVAHLHPAAGTEPAVAMPLTAAAGTWRVRARILPLSQGTFFERALCQMRGLDPVAVPPRGTVAASALELAWALRAAAVVVAGLDLCHRDLRTHVRPNVFDHFLGDRSNRLSPYFHRLFASGAALAGTVGAGQHRTPGRRSGVALQTYAGWFAALTPPSGTTLLRLLPSEVRLAAFRDLDAAAFRSFATSLPRRPSGVSRALPTTRRPSAPRTDAAARRNQAVGLIREWSRRLDGARTALPEGGPARLFSDAFALGLCYYAAAGPLAEALRLLRLASCGGEKRLGEAVSEALGVLQSIRSELGGA